MKQLFTLMATGFFCIPVSAQTGSDSIRIGNMIIVKKSGERTEKNSAAGIKMTADTTKPPGKETDSIRIGNMIIVKAMQKIKITIMMLTG